MAVSMNSGFMRSDFMISDAALPMRMEELEQLEQAAKFSEILGGFGKTSANEAQTNVAPANEAADEAVVMSVEKTDAPVTAISVINTEKGETEVTVVVSKEELKELAMAVVKGRIKLDELPEALVTDVLLMAIAMIMLGVPEDEIKALQEDVTFTVTEIEKEAMSQFVSLMVVPKLNAEAEQNENTAEAMPAELIEIPDELRAELEMIIDKLVGTEEAQTEVEADVKTDAASDTEKQEIVSEGDKPTEETAVKTVSENMIPDAAEPVVTYESVKDIQESVEAAPVEQISADADVEIQEQKNVFVEITSEATEELFTVSEQTIEGSKQPVEVSKQQITVSEQPLTISEELEQIRKIITEPSARKTEATQTVAATEAATVQAVTQTASTQQNNGADEQTQSFVKADVNPMQTRAADNADQLQAEFEQLRSIVSEIQVKHESPKPIVQQPMSRVPQEFRTDETVKNRMVVKSDELMMLKNASKPVADNEAAATQAAMIPQGKEQLPVVFTRADGTEFAVKPEEILKQVADNIIQHTETANAEGNTEYSVTLTPEDLGSITVRMTKTADGTFSVSITADNARTQRIIEESGLAIQNSLKQNGIELESWQTVNESEQQERAEDYNGSSKNPYYQEEQSENDEAEDTSFAEMISAM